MNTTQLIEHWTMQGAEKDIDRRFRATDDILEVMAAQHDAQQGSRLAPVQVRGADDEGWTALQVGG